MHIAEPEKAMYILVLEKYGTVCVNLYLFKTEKNRGIFPCFLYMSKIRGIMKMMALVIACVMIIAMAVPALANGTTPASTGHTISVKDNDTHEYKVFQVLTGTLSEAGSAQLGNPAWGADATDAAKMTDVKNFITEITASGISDQDIAQKVAEKVDITKNGRGTVKKGQPLTNLATGYYVMVDVTTLNKYGENPEKIDTKALNVVRVVNDINGIEIKWGTTEDKKEITGDTLGNATTTNPRTPDAADEDNVSIGDTVNFKITAKVPDNVDKYNYFYFVINDTLDEGLTLNPDSIKVYKTSVTDANKLAVTTDYLMKTGTDAAPKSFQVGLVDAKSHGGEDIIVTYSAVLNEKAKVGETANKNTSTVTYSNDPNHDYNGDPKNPKPGFPDSTDLQATGETPSSVTETYTTGIEIQKVDENGNVLTGAEFTITGDSTEIVLVSSETFAEAADGEYYGLKNGTYTKEAPVAADYMKEAAAGATKGYVEDANATGDDVVTIGGKTYRPVTAEDSDKTVYILVKANSDQYDGKRYKKTVTYTQKNTKANPAVNAKAEVGPDGVVRFVGLGAGTYTITETKTPAGYNTLAPVNVTIKFTANPTGEGAVHWSKTSGDATYNKDTGVFEMTIENNKGTELPSTGGIGTTIFYIVGACIVIGAGVLLVTRRRMNAN